MRISPDLPALTRTITAAAVRHGDALPDHLAQTLQISRRRAQALLRKLVQSQWLVRSGTARRAVYQPGPLRQVVCTYALPGLQEDQPWRHDFAPFFALPREVQRMAQHAFTELVNNAADHSGGTQVTVSMRQTPLQLQMLVSDDGCGLFQHIAQAFDIDDPRLALLELSKGKLTSAPDRHAGHGLFFTSRLADVFDIHANHHGFQRRAWEAQAWHPARQVARAGTSIYLAISLDTPRTLSQVLREHGVPDNPLAFERTVVPMHLLADDQVLASRAAARRAVARLGHFRRAELDFTGVQDIGHGFADELFRVCRRDLPQLQMVPVGMAPPVEAMVRSIAGALG